MKYKIIIFSLIGVLLLGTAGFFVFREEPKKRTSFASPDLSQHPLYSHYKYSTSENLIYIGTQPLYLPTGLITESMKRDNILRKELSKLGFELQYRPFLKGNDVNFFLKQGILDAGIGGDMPTIRIAALSEVVIASLIQYGPTAIVAKRLMMLEQLKGKRIGYGFGSNAHYMLLDALSSAGLGREDVELVSLDINRMPEALEKNTIDAFAGWEPTPEMFVINFGGHKIYQRFSSGYVYFRRAFTKRNPEAVRIILAAQIRAIEWLRKDKSAVLLASQWAINSGEKVSGMKFRLTVDQNAALAAEDIIGRHSVLSPELRDEDIEENGLIHKEFLFMKTIGFLPPSSQWESVRKSFDLRILPEIRSASNQYRLNDFDYRLE